MRSHSPQVRSPGQGQGQPVATPEASPASCLAGGPLTKGRSSGSTEINLCRTAFWGLHRAALCFKALYGGQGIYQTESIASVDDDGLKGAGGKTTWILRQWLMRMAFSL
jgi:hypothetical protein